MKTSLVPNMLFLTILALLCPVMAAPKNAPTIQVMGEVSRPGAYSYHKGDKASSAICQAGITLKSDLTQVQVVRPVKGKDTVIRVDAGWIFTNTRVASAKPTGVKDVDLRPGDAVMVPARTPMNVTRDLKDVPLAAALDSILKDSGVNYWIDPALKESNLKVTAVLKNVSLDSAINTVIGASGISYQVEDDNVLKFRPSPAYAASGGVGRVASGFGASDKGTNSSSTGNDTEKIVQIIPLKYIKTGDAAPMITGIKGISSVQSSGDSQLVVSGSREAVNQAVEVLSKIDLPDAYPRIIRVLMEIDLKTEDTVHTIKTEAVGRDREPMPMQLIADFPVNNEQGIGSISLNATVTPNYVDSNQITLDGEGIVTCTERESSASGKQLAKLEKPFKFTVSVPEASAQAQDKAAGSRGTVISSGDISVDEAKAGFTIYIKAKVEGRAAKGASPRYGLPGAGYGGPVGGMPPGSGGFVGRVQEPKK